MRKLITSLGLVAVLLTSTILSLAQAQKISPFVVPAWAYTPEATQTTFVDISTNPNTVMLGNDLADGNTSLVNCLFEATSETNYTPHSKENTTNTGYYNISAPLTEPCFPLGFDFRLSGKKMKYFIVNAMGGAYFSETPLRAEANSMPAGGYSSGYNAIYLYVYVPTSSTATSPGSPTASNKLVKTISGQAPAMYLIEGTEGNHVLTIQYHYMVNNDDEWKFQYKFYENGTYEFIVGQLPRNSLASYTCKRYDIVLGFVESCHSGTAAAATIVEGGSTANADKEIDVLGPAYLCEPAAVSGSQHKAHYPGTDFFTFNKLSGNHFLNTPGTLISGKRAITYGDDIPSGSTLRFNYPTDCGSLTPLSEDDYNYKDPALGGLNTGTTYTTMLTYNMPEFDGINYGPLSDFIERGPIVAVLSASKTPDYTMPDGTLVFAGDELSQTAIDGQKPTVLCNRYPKINASNTKNTFTYSANTTSSQNNEISITVETEGKTRYIHLYRMGYACDGAPAYSPLCHTIRLGAPMASPKKLEIVGTPTVNGVTLKAESADGLRVMVVKTSSLNLKPSGQLRVGDKFGANNAEVVAIFSGEQTFNAYLEDDEKCYFVAFSVDAGEYNVFDTKNTATWVSTRAAYDGFPGIIDISKVETATPHSPYPGIPFGWTRAIEETAGYENNAFKITKLGLDNYRPNALWAINPPHIIIKENQNDPDPPAPAQVLQHHDIITPPIRVDKTKIVVSYSVGWYVASTDGVAEYTGFDRLENNNYTIQYDYCDNNWQVLNTLKTNALPAKDKYGNYAFEKLMTLDDSKVGQYMRFRYIWEPTERKEESDPAVYHAIHYVTIQEAKGCQTPTGLTENKALATSSEAGLSWNDPNNPKAPSYKVFYRPVETVGAWEVKTVSTPNAVLENLKFHAEYYVRVSAVCADGEESYLADSVMVSTMRGFPYFESMAQQNETRKIQGMNMSVPVYTPMTKTSLYASVELLTGGVETASGTVGGALTVRGENDRGSYWSEANTVGVVVNSSKEPTAVGVKENANNAWLLSPMLYVKDLKGREQVVRFKVSAANGTRSYKISTGYTTTWTQNTLGTSYGSKVALKVYVSNANNGQFTAADLVGTVDGLTGTLNNKEYEFKLPTTKEGRVQVGLFYTNSSTSQNNKYMVLEIKDLAFELYDKTCPELEGELTVSDITTQGATVSWEDPGIVNHYVVSWWPADGNEADAESEVTGATTFTITGADDHTTYNVKVEGYCDEGDENPTPNFLEGTFTTLEACHTPENFKVEDITYNSATFSSTPAAQVTDYNQLVKREIRLVDTKDKTHTHFYNQENGNNTLVATDLHEDRTVMAVTRAVCSNDTSEWSEPITFTTPVDPAHAPDVFDIVLKMQPEGAGEVFGAGRYMDNEEVLIKAKADEDNGYRFVKWLDADGNQVSTEATHSWTATWEGESDTKVHTIEFTAVFMKQYAIALLTDPEGSTGGTVTLNGQATNMASFDEGTDVTIKAEPKQAYKFAGWKKKDGSFLSTEAEVTVQLTEDVIYTAVFILKPYFALDVTVTPDDLGSVSFDPQPTEEGKFMEGRVVTMTAEPADYCQFVEWRDADGNSLGSDPTHTVTMNGDKAFTAVFAHIQYEITLVSNPDKSWGTINGTNGQPSDGGTFNAGTQRSLEAKPAPGYVFEKWMSGTKELGTNPVLKFILAQDTTITAYFIEKDPLEIKVTVEPANAGTVTGAGTVDRGASATLTPNANAGYVFQEWRRADGSTTTSNPYTITSVLRDYTFTAVFRTLNNYTVNVTTTEGGKVTNPVGATVTGPTTYQEGSQVTLTAVPDAHYVFTRWEDGNGNELETESATLSFKATGSTTVKAVFTKLPEYTVTVNRYVNTTSTPAAGTITVNGEEKTTGTFEVGTEVSLSAAPAKGYTFVGWRNTGNETVSTDNPFKFNISDNVTYRAVFAENIRITLTVTPTGAGTATGAGLYDANDPVSLNATANDDYVFVAWKDGETVLGTNTTLAFNATVSKTITAQFRAKEYYSLNVTYTEERGSVAINPAADAESGKYEESTEVTLTASPKTYYSFLAWVNGNNNQDTLSKETVYKVTMNSNKSVRAVFARIQYTVTVASSPSTEYGTIQNMEGGTASGSYKFDAGSQRELKPQPRAGYLFDKWLIETASGTTESKASTYQYTVTQNIKITAVFKEKNPLDINVTVMLGEDENPAVGSVTVTGEGVTGNQVPRGKNAVLTATANAHYAFKEWQFATNTYQDNPHTVTNVTRDYTVKAVFRALDNYTVTVTHNTGGTVTKDGTEVTATISCEEGSTLTLTAEPQEGYAFRNWTVNGNAVLDAEATHTFTPTGNVTINAVFTKLDQFHVALYRYYNGGLWVDAGKLFVNDEDTREGDFYDGETITIKAVPNKGYHFVEWRTYDGFGFVSSDNPYEFAVTSETEYWAVFEANIKIDVAIAPKDENPGTVTINGETKTTGLFDKDDAVTLEATPNSNYVFVGWKEGETVKETNATYSFTATESKTVTAQFRAKEYYTLDVEWNGQLGNVTFNPEANKDGEYQEGTVVTMTAAPKDKYHEFLGWQDKEGNIVSTELTHKVTMDRDTAGSALFARIQYTVTLESNPADWAWGTINGTDGNTSEGGTFDAGTQRRLEAKPLPGYLFQKWTSGGQDLGTAPVYTFTLEQDITITAHFIEKNPLVITVNIEPANAGTVTGAGEVARGASATLTAIPAEHYAFKEWRRSNGTSTNNPYEIASVLRDHTLTAVFRALNNYTVNVTNTAGGKVTDAEGGTVSGNNTYEEGSTVTLTAVPDEHYVFAGWQDAEGNELETEATYTFTATGNTTVKAVFSKLSEYTVTVNRYLGTTQNAGVGTITVSGDKTPAGKYEVGTEVSLSATANHGYSFVEWRNTDNEKVSDANPFTFNIAANVTYRAVFKENIRIDVTVVPEDDDAGEVTGAGLYDENDQVTLKAIADEDYVFVAWKEGAQVLGTDTLYKFTATESRNIRAEFRLREYYGITVYLLGSAEDEEDLGSVSIPGGDEGHFQEGRTITMTATPKAYCKFVEWRDAAGNKLEADGNTYTFVIDQDMEFYAVFEHIKYTVTLKSDPSAAYGTIKGTTGNTTTGGMFNAGTTRKLTAQPRTGYTFVKWMEGTTELGTDTVYTFVLTRDITITAYFKQKDSLDIKVTVDPAVAGKVTGAGKVKRGNNAVLTATANAAYKFQYWMNVAGDEIEANPYTLQDVQRDYTFTAKFRAKYQYTITVTRVPNATAGTIERKGFLANDKAREDATVSLTAIPAEGYTFTEWQDADGKRVSTEATLTLTATANATYKAVFAEIPTSEYTVTLLREPVEGGRISGDGTYEEGMEATITATPNAHYTFDGWYNGAEKISAEATHKFTVTADVTYTAKFTKRPTVDVDITVRLGETVDATVGTVTGAGEYDLGKTVTLTATPASEDYLFSGWRDLDNDDELVGSANPFEFTASKNVHYAAVFREKFEVTLNILPDENAGTLTGAGPGRQGYPKTITAEPAEGYSFLGWYDETGNTLITTETSHTFVLEENVTFTAKFEAENENEVNITVKRMPGNEAGTVKGNGRYEIGEKATLTATAATNYLFVAWLTPKADDVTKFDTIKSNPYSFTVEGDAAFTALFRTRARYMIEVDVLPNDNAGTVTGDGEVREGRTVTLTAEPATGYTFVAWVNPALTAPRDTVSRSATYVFAATGNATYKAIFRRAAASYTVTLNTTPAAGGTVEGDGTYREGQTVTINAKPNAGYRFSGWRSGNTIVSREPTYQFQITKNMTFTAVFSKKDIMTVTLNATPENAGTVTGGGEYPIGAEALITATANNGYVFVEWQDENGEAVSHDAQYTFTVVTDATYTAVFEEGQTVEPVFYNITLETLPNSEAGTVTGAGRYEEGATVTVTATANEGYKFVQWQDADGNALHAGATYTFEATADVTYAALFEKTPVIAETTVTISLKALPSSAAGTLKGAGKYEKGKQVTIEAIPAANYTFVAWLNAKGDTVGKKATYTFTAQTDASYSALFEAKKTANEHELKAAFNVAAGNGQLFIENLNGVVVRDVTVFNTVGRQLAHFTPNSNANLALPVDARYTVLVVRVVSEQGLAIYKVYLH